MLAATKDDGSWPEIKVAESGHQLKTKSTEYVAGGCPPFPVTNRQRSNEETSYAAAVTGKNGNGDVSKTTGGWGGGDGLRNGHISCDAGATVVPTSSKTAVTATATVNGIGNLRAVYNKPVGVQVNPTVPRKVSVGCQTSNKGRIRNQSQMTDRLKCKNQGVTAKLCACDGLIQPTAPVEFYGDHFKFEVALSKVVADLGISFFEREEPQINGIQLKEDL